MHHLELLPLLFILGLTGFACSVAVLPAATTSAVNDARQVRFVRKHQRT